MLIAGVEVQNEQLFKELDSFFFKRYKSRFDTEKFMCTLCNVEHHKCYTLQHFQTCQRHMTNKFIVTLKTYVQHYNIRELSVVHYLSFSNLNIHPLDNCTIKILKKLFVFFALTGDRRILLSVFQILNIYNTPSFTPASLTFNNPELKNIYDRSHHFHKTIIATLYNYKDEVSKITFLLALSEIREMYFVSLACD